MQSSNALPVLLVFSHLRWNFVYQRPQHLLSRLARRWRVFMVEEPVYDEGEPRIEWQHLMPGVTVLVPHTPVQAPGFHDAQVALLEPLIFNALRERDIRPTAHWLYTPMALPLLGRLPGECLVYDCMDELASFKDAPRQLRQRESALLRLADVVFTGGPSLHESKRHVHANVHCVPSSVDAAAFAPSRLEPHGVLAHRAQALQGSLARPRLGYYGVIDERLDLGLVDLLAERHADWSIVMVGPVAKIDPATLPRRPNLHWLGMQPYELLPYLLAGWDLCLMPFALNEATRHISPTKTLEYMAGERRVVSTPVHDVAALYGHAVEIAASGPAFVAACERTLAEDPAVRAQKLDQMLRTVAMHSWDHSADTMHRQILHSLAARRPGSVVLPARRSHAGGERAPRPALDTATTATAATAAKPAALPTALP